MTSVARILHIPHKITEFDEEMLKPLDDNFSAVQRHVARTQVRVRQLEENQEDIINTLNDIEILLTEIVNALSTGGE